MLADRFKQYRYIVFLGLSSSLALIKGYAYSFLFSDIGFAHFNLYLMFLNLFALLAPMGFLLKCHSAIPALLNSGAEAEVRELTSKAKSIATVNFLFFILVTLWIPDSTYVRLGLVQGYLFALFFIDQIVVKSRLQMVLYAWRVLLRNLLVAIGGAMGFILLRWLVVDELAVVLSEVMLSLLMCSIYGSLRFEWHSDILFSLCRSRSYFVLTLMGLLLSMGDRLLASIFLTTSEFAHYSYFYVIVTVGATVQSFINTRFMVEVSISQDYGLSLQRALTRGWTLFLFMMVVGATIMLPLSLNSFYYDKSGWPILSLFILLSALKSCDFLSTICIVFDKRMQLIGGQVVYVCLICLLITLLYYVDLLSMVSFLLVSVITLAIYLIVVYLYLRFYVNVKADLASSI
jgi:hypothetical protein